MQFQQDRLVRAAAELTLTSIPVPIPPTLISMLLLIFYFPSTDPDSLISYLYSLTIDFYSHINDPDSHTIDFYSLFPYYLC